MNPHEGVSRRDFMKLGMKGVFLASLPSWVMSCTAGRLNLDKDSNNYESLEEKERIKLFAAEVNREIKRIKPEEYSQNNRFNTVKLAREIAQKYDREMYDFLGGYFTADEREKEENYEKIIDFYIQRGFYFNREAIESGGDVFIEAIPEKGKRKFSEHPGLSAVYPEELLQSLGEAEIYYINDPDFRVLGTSVGSTAVVNLPRTSFEFSAMLLRIPEESLWNLNEEKAWNEFLENVVGNELNTVVLEKGYNLKSYPKSFSYPGMYGEMQSVQASEFLSNVVSLWTDRNELAMQLKYLLGLMINKKNLTPRDSVKLDNIQPENSEFEDIICFPFDGYAYSNNFLLNLLKDILKRKGKEDIFYKMLKDQVDLTHKYAKEPDREKRLKLREENNFKTQSDTLYLLEQLTIEDINMIKGEFLTEAKKLLKALEKTFKSTSSASP